MRATAASSAPSASWSIWARSPIRSRSRTCSRATGRFDEVGGADYLARLAASVVTIINAGDYGRTVFDRHLRRALIEIGSDIVNEAYNIDLDLDAPAQIEQAEQHLHNLATAGETRRDFAAFHRGTYGDVRSSGPKPPSSRTAESPAWRPDCATSTASC